MIDSVSRYIENDDKTSLLLVDIGVWAFRDVLKNHPDRARNIGVFEPGIVSLAAGLSLMGITPTVYGITPFIVERALEQLKLDFIYQKVGGNFITTGASYDFSTLGYSHYCPEDAAMLRMLPGMEIVVPGTPDQFSTLFAATCKNGNATYFRMTDHCNVAQVNVEFGKAAVLKRGKAATIIAVAETLDVTLEACSNLDVTILYYTTVAPFDHIALRQNLSGGKILICEPFYVGTLAPDVIKSLDGTFVAIDDVGVPLEVLRGYGSKKDLDAYCGITAEQIRERAIKLIER